MHKALLISNAIKVPAPGDETSAGQLIGASCALAAAELAQQLDRPLLVVAEDPRHADQLEAEIRFFAGDDLPLVHFVEWETLPWDSFSPHLDIISQRLSVLAALPSMQNGIIIATAAILQQRLPPLDYVAARSLSLLRGQALPRAAFTRSLLEAATFEYRRYRSTVNSPCADR